MDISSDTQDFLAPHWLRFIKLSALMVAVWFFYLWLLYTFFKKLKMIKAFENAHRIVSTTHGITLSIIGASEIYWNLSNTNMKNSEFQNFALNFSCSYFFYDILMHAFFKRPV